MRQASDCLLAWHNQWGYNPHGMVSILPNGLAWLDPEGRGAISYFRIGDTWLASEPFAPDIESVKVARSFLLHAKREGMLVGFLPATARFAMHADELGLDAAAIGVSPYFELRTWMPRGDRAKKVRSGINQARRNGVWIEETPPAQLSKTDVADLCSNWLQTRRTKEFGWVFAVDPLRFSEFKRFFVARNPDGVMLGLLVASPIPARNGWYLEDVLRNRNAPNGTSELLIVESMASLAGTGSSLATLGTILAAHLDFGEPMNRGNHHFAQRMLLTVEANMEAIYNFSGLRRFKKKFAPSWWEAEFAMFPPGFTHSVRIATAAIRAIADAGVFHAIWNGSWNEHSSK